MAAGETGDVDTPAAAAADAAPLLTPPPINPPPAATTPKPPPKMTDWLSRQNDSPRAEERCAPGFPAPGRWRALPPGPPVLLSNPSLAS